MNFNWQAGIDKDGNKSKYFLQCNDYTITKAANVKYTYGLYQGNVNHGYFLTVDEAKNKHREITK